MSKTLIPNGGNNDRAILNGFYFMPGIIGNVWYVNSAAAASGNGLSPESAFQTLAAAVVAATANNGDTIFVLPGHAESLSGVGAIALSKAGLTIIGLGEGSLRPTFTWHTTATTIAVSAANIRIENVVCATDVDAVVSMWNVTAAGLTLNKVDFVETPACAALQFLITSAAGDDLTISNCRWIQTTTAATALQAWIKPIGADRLKIVNCFANLKGYATSNPANGVIVGATTLGADVQISGNTFISTNSTGAIVISLYTGTTGFVNDNRVASAKTAIAGQVACASCYASNNYAGHVVNTSGLLDPVVDA